VGKWVGLYPAGFEPGASIFPAVVLDRDSFDFYGMEAVWSNGDRWLLDFISAHKFTAKDFYVKRDGGTHLMIKITPVLADTVPLWSKKIEPVVERVKMILMDNKLTE
jgi:hypothetical protein